MSRTYSTLEWCLSFLLVVRFSSVLGADPVRVKNVDGEAIGLFHQDAGDWLSHGRTYSDQRYSPLYQVNTKTVGDLGLAWQASLESPMIGVEATPIVVDGILYTTSTFSRVFAFDAASGRKLWTYDPEVPRDWMNNGCCKAVNRGVAIWKGKIYVGTFDGRLIAINAKTGRKEWEVDTTNRRPGYTITGAPIVANGKVIIGNGGAEFGTRGFFSAYDAETGKLKWRFYTVPGAIHASAKQPELALAAKTWPSLENS